MIKDVTNEQMCYEFESTGRINDFHCLIMVVTHGNAKEATTMQPVSQHKVATIKLVELA